MYWVSWFEGLEEDEVENERERESTGERRRSFKTVVWRFLVFPREENKEKWVLGQVSIKSDLRLADIPCTPIEYPRASVHLA